MGWRCVLEQSVNGSAWIPQSARHVENRYIIGMTESDDPLNADQILIDTALRFDGYKFIHETDFDTHGEIEKRYDDQPTDWNDLQLMSIFFILQRGLGKWSLVYEKRHGKYWRIFREMFFEVIELEVPREYYHEERYGTWHARYAHRLSDVIQCVRDEHESIEYDDYAEPH